MLKIIYIKDPIIEHSTQITYINILTNIQLMFSITVKQIKTHNVKKAYYNLNNDIVINKHDAINTNDTYNITKSNNSLNDTDTNYYTKRNFNTSNIPNNITRHINNNYEHNVIKEVNKHNTYS